MCKRTIEIAGPQDTVLRFMIDDPITICEIVSPEFDENGKETDVEDIWSYGLGVRKDGDTFKRSIGIEKAAKSAIEKFERQHRAPYWVPVLQLVREEREKERAENELLTKKSIRRLSGASRKSIDYGKLASQLQALLFGI